MSIRIKRFYSSKKDFQAFYRILKQVPCPHCRLTGCLILHGFLYGHDVGDYGEKLIRGHRIFCNNRKRSRGCGRTFSVLASNILKKFVINTTDLWQFLKNTKKGLSKKKAFKSSNLQFSESTIYRLWNKFCNRQSRIRTFLLKLCKPPKASCAYHPAVQTILHLESAFKKYSCPISAFQENFQVSFL